jgi:hypothetical protein
VVASLRTYTNNGTGQKKTVAKIAADSEKYHEQAQIGSHSDPHCCTRVWVGSS